MLALSGEEASLGPSTRSGCSAESARTEQERKYWTTQLLPMNCEAIVG